MPDSPAAAILTLGCKLNIADSEAMARGLRHDGWAVRENVTGAEDVIVINTCSVTSMADQKSRRLVRQASRNSPGARIVLTGCMVETATPQTLSTLPADDIVRQQQQHEMIETLIASYAAAPPSLSTVPVLRTRAFIAAQQGCNDVCAFCVIPRTRGRERSKPIAAIVAEAQQREREGVQELVVTGTQLGAYGRDRGNPELAALLEALLHETSLPRIRISSVQPQDVSPALLALWQDKRLCRHLHLALQSGSDTTLRRMRRRYSSAQYRQALDLIRSQVPEVAITTDVIAGFPGEGADEFEESYAFCREMNFSAMHVFPYSPRIGTSAEKLPDQVNDDVKKQRVQRFAALAKEMATEYRGRFLGQTVAVLWESPREDGHWEGLTDTYLRVRCRSGLKLHNQITEAHLLSLSDEAFEAEVNL